MALLRRVSTITADGQISVPCILLCYWSIVIFCNFFNKENVVRLVTAFPDSIPRQVMWDLWWTKWHWGRYSPSTSVSPVIFRSTNCSIFINNPISTKTTLLKNKQDLVLDQYGLKYNSPNIRRHRLSILNCTEIFQMFRITKHWDIGSISPLCVHFMHLVKAVHKNYLQSRF
jgi:hypothetical protein